MILSTSNGAWLLITPLPYLFLGAWRSKNRSDETTRPLKSDFEALIRIMVTFRTAIREFWEREPVIVLSLVLGGLGEWCRISCVDKLECISRPGNRVLGTGH